MSPGPVIRPLQPSDRDAVGNIAYQTGFFGNSAELYFPARPLFELLWAGPYFGQPGALGFVAVMDGQVVGYIVGFTGQGAYQSALARTVLRDIWRVPRTPGLGASLTYLLRAARSSAPHASWQQYPAHLHMNLLPQARGLRLGEGLLQAYLRLLQDLKVPGVQLSTTAENRAALHLYRKFGFEVLAARVTPLWTPWLGHPAEHLIMGRRLELVATAEG